MRIAVCGHGRHGKETISKMISTFTGLRYRESTSQAASRVVFSAMQDANEEEGPTVYSYESASDAWEHRAEHRAFWADAIWNYNKPHGVTLYREMIRDNDILDGIRHPNELGACRQHGLVTFSIWIDASKRLPPESISSCKITGYDCDVVVNNNGTLSDLQQRVAVLCAGLAATEELHHRQQVCRKLLPPDAVARLSQLKSQAIGEHEV